MVALSATAATSPAQSIAYVGRLQYATGDFNFSQRISAAYFANGLVVAKGPLQLSASLPVLMQSSGMGQYSGTGMMVPSRGMAAATGSYTAAGNSMHGASGSSAHDMGFNWFGIGDPVGRVDLTMARSGDLRASLRLVGTVKAPMADARRGFGTGEWDSGAGFSSNLRIGPVAVLAETIYWNLGNPDGAFLRNAVAYTLSVGRPLPDGRWSVVGNVSGASSLWRGMKAPVQAGFGTGYLLKSGESIYATVSAGLTGTAASFSTGLAWRIPLGKQAPQAGV